MSSQSSYRLIPSVLFEGGMALLALFVGWLIGFSPLEKLPHSWTEWQAAWPAVLWGVAATVPMVVGLFLLEWIPLRTIAHLREMLRRIIVPLFGEATVFDLAILSLMAGVGEEVLFRGLIQGGLAAWIGGESGLWLALAVSSLVFGLAHALTRLYAVLATLIGIYLGLLYLLTDSLVAPILAHALYDFIALVWLLKFRWRER